MFALIMAGGVGTRFWPRSREKTPKQLLRITGNSTMIQDTVRRLSPLIPKDRTFIITTRSQVETIVEQIPEIPAEHVLVEPKGKNTAPCIGLAALFMKRIDPEAAMAVLPADHLIEDEERFRKVLAAGEVVAKERNGLVTIGIQPTYPATGYGYIQFNEKLGEVGSPPGQGVPVYKVKTFAEKPILETARRFLDSGDFLWNSGIFVWKVSTILRDIEEHMPELYDGLMEIDAAIGRPEYEEVLHKVYCQIRSISIDYGILEHAEDVVVLRGDFGWNDVGSWEEVYKILPKDHDENAILGEHMLKDTRRCLVDSPKRFVAAIGLEDLIIVDSEDAILICRRDRAQEVKDLVEAMKRKKLARYL